MKRILFAFFAVIFSLSFFLPVVVAAQEMEIAPDSGVSRTLIYPPPGEGLNFLGQNHRYSVVFRGNGEAVITLKVALYNDSESPTTEVPLRVSKVNPVNIGAYQIIIDRQCVRYGQGSYDPVTGRYNQGECLQYQEPDYFNYYGQGKYQRAETRYEGDTIYVKLPQEIAANASGAFFLYFRAMGFAKKSAFGVYRYEFETLKVNDEINTLNIGINTDSDLFLRGAKGEVNYRFEESDLAKVDSMAAGAPVASTQLDQFVQQIGSGVVTKSASNLAPLESYSTKGAYASSRIRLYAKELVIGAIVLILVLAVLLLAMRFVWRMLTRRSHSEGEERKSSTPGAGPMILASGGAGFVSAFFAVGYTAFLVFVMENVSNWLNYRYEGMFIVLILIISLGVYLFFLIVPALVIGVKRGAAWGVATFIFTLVWLMLMFAVLFVGVSVLQNGPEIYPLFRRSINDSGVPAPTTLE